MDEMKQEPSSDMSFVPIDVRVSIGHAQPTIRDLMALNRGSVLSLDRRIEDPVELYVGDQLIGKGELQEGEGEEAGTLIVRLTEVTNNRTGAD